MKLKNLKFLGPLLCSAVFFLLALLPVLPVLSGPVIYMPNYHVRFVSFYRWIWPYSVGMVYDGQWYTYLSVLGLVVVSIALGLAIKHVFVNKRL